MFSFQRVARCSLIAAMLTALSNVALAIPVSSFQFGGSLQVAPGAGATPATITFNPNFSIISQNGLVVGDLISLTGNLNGSYQFNDPAGSNIVTVFSPTTPNTFTIDDGTDLFTAEIGLIELQGGGGGSIIGAIDFSTSNYAGVNPALVELNGLIQNSPDLTVTFQTLGGFGVNLDELFDNGSGGVATYSAAVNVSAGSTPIPEPAPLALLGLGLLCSASYALRRRAASNS